MIEDVPPEVGHTSEEYEIIDDGSDFNDDGHGDDDDDPPDMNSSSDEESFTLGCVAKQKTVSPMMTHGSHRSPS